MEVAPCDTLLTLTLFMDEWMNAPLHCYEKTSAPVMLKKYIAAVILPKYNLLYLCCNLLCLTFDLFSSSKS